LQFRDSTITRRVSTKESAATQALFQEEPISIKETKVTVSLFAAFSIPKVYYAPDGSMTISNPVETYYQSLLPGFNQVKEALTIALESSVIQSIMAFVDNRYWVECILKPGYQVITMSAS
jgi:hypothetical protein